MSYCQRIPRCVNKVVTHIPDVLLFSLQHSGQTQSGQGSFPEHLFVSLAG